MAFGNDLNQILRANAFLLLYNIVESSVSQALEKIHINLVVSGCGYDNLSDNLKKEVVEFVKKSAKTDDFVTQVENIANDILNYYPEKKDFFSGNVDAKEIKKMSKKYGFSCSTDARKTDNGAKLLPIKSHRNDLAHGFISFKECGKDYTIQDMMRMKKEVLSYIGEILENIDSYLIRQEFKRPQNVTL